MDTNERVYTHTGSVVYPLFAFCGAASVFAFIYAFGNNIGVTGAVILPLAVGMYRSCTLFFLGKSVKVTISSSVVLVSRESEDVCVSIGEIRRVRADGTLFLHNGKYTDLQIALHPFCREVVHDIRLRINR